VLGLALHQLDGCLLQLTPFPCLRLHPYCPARIKSSSYHRSLAGNAGGPDESDRIAALEGRAAGVREAAERLEGRCVPRPMPPAYLALREEVARFLEGFAAVGRVAEMVQVDSACWLLVALLLCTTQYHASLPHTCVHLASGCGPGLDRC
jgi:hypothetical protein